MADIVAPMQTSAISQAPAASDADTIALGIFDGEGAPSQTPAVLGELLSSSEARSSFKALALTHAEGKRWLLIGLGARDQFTAERARVAACTVGTRARELSTQALCWGLPDGTGAQIAAAIVEGTALGDY